MAPEGQKPSQWQCLTKLPREMYSQPIVHKALSWGAIRKSTCILDEVTIRKSQFVALSRGFYRVDVCGVSRGNNRGSRIVILTRCREASLQ
jgi:hypothetical protein